MVEIAPIVTLPQTPTHRRRLFAAFAYDIVTFVGALLATGMLAGAWLLARTGFGRIDPTGNEAVVAFAVWGAALPAWTVWQWRSLASHGTSVGMYRTAAGPGTPLLLSSRRRIWWYVLHPVTVPGWIWLSLTLLIPGPWQLAVLPLSMSVLQTAIALTSCIVVFVAPNLTPGHVRIARGRRRRRG